MRKRTGGPKSPARSLGISGSEPDRVPGQLAGGLDQRIRVERNKATAMLDDFATAQHPKLEQRKSSPPTTRAANGGKGYGSSRRQLPVQLRSASKRLTMQPQAPAPSTEQAHQRQRSRDIAIQLGLNPDEASLDSPSPVPLPHDAPGLDETIAWLSAQTSPPRGRKAKLSGLNVLSPRRTHSVQASSTTPQQRSTTSPTLVTQARYETFVGSPSPERQARSRPVSPKPGARAAFRNQHLARTLATSHGATSPTSSPREEKTARRTMSQDPPGSTQAHNVQRIVGQFALRYPAAPSDAKTDEPVVPPQTKTTD